jgi:uncharacterized protein involved in response to NO
MAEIEHVQPAPAARVSRWRTEPFRIFFPLGVLLAWIGVGHWLTYSTGITSTYSCRMHGLIQMQAFMMAFAIGFLLTALPNRTRSAPVSAAEMAGLIAALIVTTAAAMAERWVVSELAYGAILALLANFALRRFIGAGAGRRPPAAFVLVPIAAIQGFAGAILIAAAEFNNVPAWSSGLGRLMVEQGVFLCLAVGVGGLILPLIAGASPPGDLGSSPRETWRAISYAMAGLAIFASFVLEQAGLDRGGQVLRAIVVAVGMVIGGGVWRAPGKTGVHRKLVWLAAWMMPAGLLVAGLWPDYRVPALHILFIGGFSLLAFGVATHVSLGHLNLERLALGRPLAVMVLGTAFMVALLIRFTADSSETYFGHLGWAAAIWILGSAAWLAFFAPRLLRPPP